MKKFVICISNESNPANLIVGKVYRLQPDTEEQTHGLLRITDEDISEPDGYLYSTSMFALIKSPMMTEDKD